VVCSISYHFHKHGQKFGTIAAMTLAAQQYFRAHRSAAKFTPEGLLQFPDGSLFMIDGRIITFIGNA
jgi:hypothetical protein